MAICIVRLVGCRREVTFRQRFKSDALAYFEIGRGCLALGDFQIRSVEAVRRNRESMSSCVGNESRLNVPLCIVSKRPRTCVFVLRPIGVGRWNPGQLGGDVCDTTLPLFLTVGKADSSAVARTEEGVPVVRLVSVGWDLESV